MLPDTSSRGREDGRSAPGKTTVPPETEAAAAAAVRETPTMDGRMQTKRELKTMAGPWYRRIICCRRTGRKTRRTTPVSLRPVVSDGTAAAAPGRDDDIPPKGVYAVGRSSQLLLWWVRSMTSGVMKTGRDTLRGSPTSVEKSRSDTRIVDENWIATMVANSTTVRLASSADLRGDDVSSSQARRRARR